MLKLYCDPVSTTSRPVILFAADSGIALEQVRISLLDGEHLTPSFGRINPNQVVPVLEHDGFVLNECSAILKYLADVVGSPAYPRGLQPRAVVNQWMDWFLSLFSKDYNYGCVYPRVLDEYRLSEPAESERRAWHMIRANRRLAILDAHLDGGGPFVCGPAISLADYLGVCFVTLGELVDFDLSAYRHVERWIATLKARPAWDQTHAAFNGWKAATHAQLGSAA